MSKEYEVKLDVFFMVTKVVEAESKKEAVELAKADVNYGEAEEVKVFEVEEL